MCLSKVYLKINSGLELVLEDTANIQVEGNTVILKDLFGKTSMIEATIQQIDLVSHKVILVNS
ncbi:MAG: CooT family nickel-binding protein [Candidatus Hodarchaeota archaeon]